MQEGEEREGDKKKKREREREYVMQVNRNILYIARR